jgi:hypothetical protein
MFNIGDKVKVVSPRGRTGMLYDAIGEVFDADNYMCLVNIKTPHVREWFYNREVVKVSHEHE